MTSALMAGIFLAMVASSTFFGIDVVPPEPTWGGLLTTGLKNLYEQPFGPVVPAGSIISTVWALNALADFLRDLQSSADHRVRPQRNAQEEIEKHLTQLSRQLGGHAFTTYDLEAPFPDIKPPNENTGISVFWTISSGPVSKDLPIRETTIGLAAFSRRSRFHSCGGAPVQMHLGIRHPALPFEIEHPGKLLFECQGQPRVERVQGERSGHDPKCFIMVGECCNELPSGFLKSQALFRDPLEMTRDGRVRVEFGHHAPWTHELKPV